MKTAMTVDTYLDQIGEPAGHKLRALRAIVKAAAPEAVESILYQMPFYKYQGRPLCSFAAFKNHIGFFAGAIVSDFTDALKGYETAKGTVRLPLDEPLPAPLIRKLLKAGMARNAAKAAEKSARGKVKSKSRKP